MYLNFPSPASNSPAIPFQKFKAMENKCEDQTKLIAELREEIEKLKGSQIDEKEVVIIIK